MRFSFWKQVAPTATGITLASTAIRLAADYINPPKDMSSPYRNGYQVHPLNWNKYQVQSLESKNPQRQPPTIEPSPAVEVTNKKVAQGLQESITHCNESRFPPPSLGCGLPAWACGPYK